jgi:hypothetical protein
MLEFPSFAPHFGGVEPARSCRSRRPNALKSLQFVDRRRPERLHVRGNKVSTLAETAALCINFGAFGRRVRRKLRGLESRWLTTWMGCS